MKKEYVVIELDDHLSEVQYKKLKEDLTKVFGEEIPKLILENGAKLKIIEVNHENRV